MLDCCEGKRARRSSLLIRSLIATKCPAGIRMVVNPDALPRTCANDNDLPEARTRAHRPLCRLK